MSAMSDYLETALINHIFRSTSFTAPTTLAIALATSAIVDSDTTLSGKEVANSFAYARQTLNPGTGNWAATSGGNGTTSNSSTITFGPASGGSWGTVTHVAICDDATYNGGNLLFWGALTTSKTVNDGDTLRFNTGDLQIQIDN